MNDDFGDDILNINLDEGRPRRVVDEQTEYSSLGFPRQSVQPSAREQQHRSFQIAQPSANLRSSEFTSNTGALSQNQQTEYSNFGLPRQSAQPSEREQQPSANLRSSESTSNTGALSRNQTDCTFLGRPRVNVEPSARERQQQSFHSIQPSANLPSSQLTSNTGALSQIQQTDYSFLGPPNYSFHPFVREQSQENFQRTQPSASLRSSMLTSNREALSQNQVSEYVFLGWPLQSLQPFAKERPQGSFHSTQPSANVRSSELPSYTEALSQIQREYSVLSGPRQSYQPFARERPHENFQEQPSANLRWSELTMTSNAQALSQNQQREYSFLSCLPQGFQPSAREWSYESFHSAQPSANLRSYELTNTVALSQNQPAYPSIDRFSLLVQREQQRQRSQSTQPFTSLPSNELTSITEALPQNQETEYCFLGRPRQSVQPSAGEQQYECFQSKQRYTILQSSELNRNTESLSQNQPAYPASDSLRLLAKRDRQRQSYQSTPPSNSVRSSELTRNMEALTQNETEYSFLDRPRQIVQHFSGERQHEGFQSTQVSTNLRSSELNSKTEALSQNQSLDDGLMEPNARKMINLEEMETLINTFKDTRGILGFTREDVILVLPNLSDGRISQHVLNNFENFISIFKNMCHLKPKIEKALDNIESELGTSYSLPWKSKSIVPNMQTETATDITKQKLMENSEMCGSVSKDSPENTTDEGPDDWITQEATDNSENVRLQSQHPQSQPKGAMSLEELLQSTETLRRRRRALGATQDEVARELKRLYPIRITDTGVLRFERFNAFIEEMCCLKRAMEEWLKDIHISQTQVSIPFYEKQILKSAFATNPNPDSQTISKIVELVNLDYELVAIWFQKYRQIRKFTKSPTDSSIPNFQTDTHPGSLNDDFGLDLP